MLPIERDNREVMVLAAVELVDEVSTFRMGIQGFALHWPCREQPSPLPWNLYLRIVGETSYPCTSVVVRARHLSVFLNPMGRTQRKTDW